MKKTNVLLIAFLIFVLVIMQVHADGTDTSLNVRDKRNSQNEATYTLNQWYAGSVTANTNMQVDLTDYLTWDTYDGGNVTSVEIYQYLANINVVGIRYLNYTVHHVYSNYSGSISTMDSKPSDEYLGITQTVVFENGVEDTWQSFDVTDIALECIEEDQADCLMYFELVDYELNGASFIYYQADADDGGGVDEPYGNLSYVGSPPPNVLPNVTNASFIFNKGTGIFTGGCAGNDTEDTTVRFNYEWFINGSSIGNGTYDTETPINTFVNITNITYLENVSFGDVVQFSCQAIDNDNGTSVWVNSTSYDTSSDVAPVVNEVSFNDNVIFTTDTFTGLCNVTDADGDDVSYDYKIYKDGVLYYEGFAYNPDGNYVVQEDANSTSWAGSTANEAYGDDGNYSTYMSLGAVLFGIGTYDTTFYKPIPGAGAIHYIHRSGEGLKIYDVYDDCLYASNDYLKFYHYGSYESGQTDWKDARRDYCYRVDDSLHRYSQSGPVNTGYRNIADTRIHWLIDHLYSSGNVDYELFNFTGGTTPNDHTTKNENWTLSCRATDGLLTSDWVNSSIMEVINTPPETIDSYIRIDPTSAQGDDDVRPYVRAIDDDGDSVIFQTRFFNNGVPITNWTNSSYQSQGAWHYLDYIDNSLYDPGDELMLQLQMFDGENWSIVYNSSTYNLTVNNNVPTVYTNVIASDNSYADENITATGRFRDYDETNLTAYYSWQIDNGSGYVTFESGTIEDIAVAVGGLTSTFTIPTFEPGDFIRDDLVRLQLTPYDGTENGTTSNSNVITIVNKRPDIANVTMEFTDREVIEVTGVVSDVDLDNVALSVVLYREGVKDVENSFCYQESANVNTTCGGLDNGSYASGFGTISSIIDGNLSTGTSFTTLLVNYSKPVNATPQSLWYLYGGDETLGTVSATTLTVEIPSVCWEEHDNFLELRWTSYTYPYGNRPQCYGGGTWNAMYDNSGDVDDDDYTYSFKYPGQLEEAMLWIIGEDYVATGETINYVKELPTEVLETGEEWTAKIYAYDDYIGDTTYPSPYNVTEPAIVPDQGPRMRNVSIAPETTYTDDDLVGTCRGTSSSDFDIAMIWKWKKNGTIMYSGTTGYDYSGKYWTIPKTIPYSETSIGDNWTLECACSDSVLTSSSSTASTTIERKQPIWSHGNYIFAQSYSQDIYFDANATHPDGLTLTYSMSGNTTGFTLNSATGVLQKTLNQSNVGEDYNVTISVTDGIYSPSRWVFFSVESLEPVVSRTYIETSTGIAGDADADLYCRNETVDADGDAILNYGVLWYRNNILQSAYTNQSTLLANATGLGEGWICSVNACDFSGCGAYRNSSQMLIGDNESPVINSTQIDFSTGNMQPFTVQAHIIENYVDEVLLEVRSPLATRHNYTMSPIEEDSEYYSKQITPLYYGTYSFRIFAKDGSGNIAIAVPSFTYVNKETTSGSSGGSSTSSELDFSDEGDSSTCKISALPKEVVLDNDNAIVEVIITNKGDASYTPTVSFRNVAGKNSILTKILLTNSLGTVSKNSQKSTGVKYKIDVFNTNVVEGEAEMVFKSDRCGELVVPITLSVTKEEVTETLLGNVGENIFNVENATFTKLTDDALVVISGEIVSGVSWLKTWMVMSVFALLFVAILWNKTFIRKQGWNILLKVVIWIFATILSSAILYILLKLFLE